MGWLSNSGIGLKSLAHGWSMPSWFCRKPSRRMRRHFQKFAVINARLRILARSTRRSLSAKQTVEASRVKFQRAFIRSQRFARLLLGQEKIAQKFFGGQSRPRCYRMFWRCDLKFRGLAH